MQFFKGEINAVLGNAPEIGADVVNLGAALVLRPGVVHDLVLLVNNAAPLGRDPDPSPARAPAVAADFVLIHPDQSLDRGPVRADPGLIPQAVVAVRQNLEVGFVI